MTSRFGTWNDVVGLPPLADTTPDQGYPAPGDTLGTLETPQLDAMKGAGLMAVQARRCGGVHAAGG